MVGSGSEAGFFGGNAAKQKPDFLFPEGGEQAGEGGVFREEGPAQEGTQKAGTAQGQAACEWPRGSFG